MCTDIYLGTNKKIPLANFNSEEPGFYSVELNDPKTIEFVNNILNQKYYYEVGSFMGCTCGLAFGDWSKQSKNEDHQKRLNDVKSFFEYLKQNRNSDIKIFATMWEEFPEKYPTKTFDIDNFPKNEFYPTEYTILKIKQ